MKKGHFLRARVKQSFYNNYWKIPVKGCSHPRSILEHNRKAAIWKNKGNESAIYNQGSHHARQVLSPLGPGCSL